MKIIFYINTFLLLCTSCIYDPPSKTVTIFNNSDKAIYVHYSCSGKMEKIPELVLFRVISPNEDFKDENNFHKPKTISPEYRVNAFSYSELAGFGSRSKFELPCENKLFITFFFIPEDTMRKYKWDVICQDELYSKKMVFSKEGLDSIHWKIIYNSHIVKK